MRILIVEDQENLAHLIKDGLESEGMAADCIYDGENALTRIIMSSDDYDLIILDVMLPKRNGIEICESARKSKVTTPIIMLTAKDGNSDVINGLNAGADDYLIKPFSFQVLLARIHAILRRPKEALPNEIKIRNINLNSTEKRVFLNNKEIHLTLKEFSLLEYFMRHPKQVLNREQIINNIWDFAFDSFSNVIDVHITNLRRKLEDKNGRIIESVRGIGYRLNP